VSAPSKRVLFVAYYFPPRGGAGVQRSLKFVKYLRGTGWEPTVLTTDYPPRCDAYDETLLEEVPEGTRIVRVESKEGFFVRMAEHGLGRLTGLSLRPDAMVTWVRRALPAARALHRREPFDAVYTSVQPWSAGLVGLRMKREFGLPWVSDFRDPWTESLHLEWPSRLHWLLDRRLEGAYLNTADRTLVVTPTMRDEFLAAHPEVPPEKIRVIYNGFDEADFEAAAAADDGKFTIVFTGRFQHDHGGDEGAGVRSWLRERFTFKPRPVILETHSPVFLLKGLAAFLEKHPQRRGKVRVVCAGTVGAGNMALAEKLGLADIVEHPGYLPHGEAVALVKSADALFLPMFSTPDPAERVAYASGKIFEYFAAGKPILALTQAGDARDLAVESGLGIAAPPRDVDSIAAAVEKLYDWWADPARAPKPDRDLIARFTRRNITAQLAETLNAVQRPGGA